MKMFGHILEPINTYKNRTHFVFCLKESSDSGTGHPNSETRVPMKVPVLKFSFITSSLGAHSRFKCKILNNRHRFLRPLLRSLLSIHAKSTLYKSLFYSDPFRVHKSGIAPNHFKSAPSKPAGQSLLG